MTFSNKMIFKACLRRDFEAMKVMLENTDNNIRDSIENTLLMQACYFNDLKMVKFLLEYNPDVNARSKYGNTALLTACENSTVQPCNVEMIVLLQMCGENPHIADWEKRSIYNLQIVIALLQHNADPNICGYEDETP